MRRRTGLGLSGAMAAGLLAWGLWPASVPDPVVRGRPLSAWLDDRPVKRGAGPNILSDEAVAAVRSLGPDAVPTLVAWLNLGDWAMGLANSPIVLARHGVERTRAVWGLRALGSAGRSAWPAIVDLILRGRDEAQRTDAINALTDADGEAARLLAAGTTDPDPAVRLRAIRALQSLHLAAEEVSYPALERLRADPDPTVRAEAVKAIGFLDFWIQHEGVVLKAIEPYHRAWAARVIGEHGSHARSLLPDLEAAANDPDPSVRLAVAEAIRRVRPPEP